MKLIKQLWEQLFIVKSKKTRTIKFMFPVVVGLIGVMVANVASTDRSYVKLVASKELVASGELFFIDVYVNAKVPVNAIDISVGFSPEVVEVTGVNTGQSVLTVWTHEPKIEKGRVHFSGGTFRRGFIGEHLIGSIKVVAKQNGRTEFFVNNAQLLAGDGSGSAVVVDSANPSNKTTFLILDQDEIPDKITANLNLSVNPDLDNDGRVTLKDVSIFMANWHSREVIYDFNGDGKMNFIDFSIILARAFFGSSR